MAAPDPSPLSVVAGALRQMLHETTGVDESLVLVGHPKSSIARSADKSRLNLFFYRVDSGAYPADGSPDNRLFVRLFCLITPFAVADNTMTDGEIELRLAGAAMQAMHRHPMLRILDTATKEQIAMLHIAPHFLSLDELNHLWATQPEVPYRFSAGYELSLVPFPLETPPQFGPRVTQTAFEVMVDPRGRSLPISDIHDQVAPQGLPVPRIQVETRNPQWAPHVLLLVDGKPQYSYVFTLANKPDKLSVVVLGATGEKVRLRWDTWIVGAADGWKPQAAVPAEAAVVAERFDPDENLVAIVNSAAKIEFPLPQIGQSMLYAERTITGADGRQVVLSSNPLMVSLREGAP